MGYFRYKAIDKSGNLMRGYRIASGSREVLRRLQDEGLRVLNLRPMTIDEVLYYRAATLIEDIKKGELFRQKAGSRRSPRSGMGTRLMEPLDADEPRRVIEKAEKAGSFRRLSLRSLNIFTTQLQVMLAAGIPLKTALHSITLTSDENLNRITIQIIALIESGHSLSDAMSRVPGAFSPFILGIFRINETGGNLSEGLEELSKYLSQEEHKRSQIIQAIVYPVFILLSCVLMVGFLIFYMLPKFMYIIKDTGSQVPFLTQLLMSLTERTVILSILSGLGIVLILAPPFFMTPMGKIYLQKILYRIPILKSFLLGTVLGRFSRTLAMLMKTSRNVVFSIKTIGKSTTDYYALDQALDDVTQEITMHGTSLSEAMNRIDLFPKIMTSMIAAGEEVGDITNLLEKYAYMEELHTQSLLQNFFSILEPMILLVMGLVVGFIVLAAFLPIFQLVQTL